MEGLDYGVTLADHMSGPADRASRAVAELGRKLIEGEAAMKGFVNQPGPLTEAKAADQANKIAALQFKMAGLKDKMSDALKPPPHVEEAAGMFDKMREGFVRVVEPAEVLKGAFEGVRAGFGTMMNGIKSGEAKEVISGIAESMAGLAQTLDLVIPGLGQIAAAAIKVVGAFAAMTVGLVQAGAELAIEATLGKLAMVSMFAALGGGQKVGEETEEMLSGLSEQIGVTKDAMAPFTKAFMAMGIEGTDALKKVTLAAISAQAIMGDPAAGHAFESLTKKIQLAAETGHQLKIPEKGLRSLADMGLRVDDVAKRLGTDAHTLSNQLKAGTVNATLFGNALQDALIEKGAGPVDRMGKSLGNMKKMFGQSIEDLFEDMGPAITPFLDRLGDLLGLFGQSTESGKAMKSAIGGAFTYIFETATEAIIPIGNFFLDTMILSVQAYTLIKSHWLSIKGVFGDLKPALDAISMSFQAIGKALETIGKADAAFSKLRSILGGGLGELGKPAGQSFAAGVADGIADGGKQVSAAGGAIGDHAAGGAADALQVKSPSRVGFKIGGFLGEGVAEGIDASAPQVGASASSMGSVAAGALARGGAGGSGAGGGVTVQGGIHVTIEAPDGVTHAGELTEAGLAVVFERLALSQGVG